MIKDAVLKSRKAVDHKDYLRHQGDQWPPLAEFYKGVYTGIPKVDKELDQFTLKFSKQGKYFPIETETSCQSKWTWNTFWLNEGTASSCHRAGWDDVTVDDFNLHNGPNKIQARKDMLEGKWPGGGCEYCKDIEDAGGHSDRQHNNLIPGLTPEEVESDQTAVFVTQRIQEIFADNTCNFSCVYCNSHLSSQIEQENHRHGEFKQKGVWLKDTLPQKQDRQQLYAKFLEWLEENVQHLRRLHLLGGETFIQHKLMNDVLGILERKPNVNLVLGIFTNMNAPNKPWLEYTKRIKNLPIKGFDLTASIDCWGPQAKYIRHGLNLEMFERRFAWASEQDWLNLNVNQTITSMTIPTMVDLIKVINKYNNKRHIGHYFEFYVGTEQYQHPKMFDWYHWQDHFARIMKELKDTTTEQKETRLRMQGIIDQLRTVEYGNFPEIENLHIYLDEIDRRRGTNWRELFPHLIV